MAPQSHLLSLLLVSATVGNRAHYNTTGNGSSGKTIEVDNQMCALVMPGVIGQRHILGIHDVAAGSCP